MRGDSIDRLCRILCPRAARRRFAPVSPIVTLAAIQPKALIPVNKAVVALSSLSCAQMPQFARQTAELSVGLLNLPRSIHRAEISWVHGSHRKQSLA
jgi:hypothetical protein